MSKITVVTHPNQNPSFLEIRAQYLKGNHSIAIDVIRANDTEKIKTSLQMFQRVANQMNVIVTEEGKFSVIGPDAFYHQPSDCVSASIYICDMIKKIAGRKPAI